MGRGDKKTKRGKITQGSFGKSRPAREIVRKTAAASKTKQPAAPAAPAAE